MKNQEFSLKFGRKLTFLSIDLSEMKMKNKWSVCSRKEPYWKTVGPDGDKGINQDIKYHCTRSPELNKV